MTATAMLRTARKDIGLHGRPNKITREYASRHGSEFLDAAWCDQSITYWARHSGTAEAVLPEGDRAYTVWHAGDFERAGRWFAGTTANVRQHAQPGDIVFFDWGGSNTIGRIDHVGVVERNLGDGRVVTIEANTGTAAGGAVMRRVRAANVIAGFGRPDYQGADMPTAKDVWTLEIPVPFGSKDNPEWQAKSVLVNNGVWLRKISGQIQAQDATIKTLVEALAARDQAVDVDALVARIRDEIGQIVVHLEAGDAE